MSHIHWVVRQNNLEIPRDKSEVNIDSCLVLKQRKICVYHESIERDLNKRLILECRCDGRLKAKAEGSTRLAYTGWQGVVYYESLKRALKTKTTYGYRCDERLKTNVGKSTRLSCTPLCAELEHLKIETRLTSSEMGEYASVM